MSRRHRAEKRIVLPDAKYGDKVVAKFINNVMEHGKKAVAEKIVYSAFDIIAQKSKQYALKVFAEALDNVKPLVEVKSRRVGGATFQVPTEIRPDRKESISMKNLILFSRKRGGRSMSEKLTAEIVDAFNMQGGAFKKKEDMHKMAEANRAFAHFRF
jgi:small subunit ribosomal protein S7